MTITILDFLYNCDRIYYKKNKNFNEGTSVLVLDVFEYHVIPNNKTETI